MRARIAGTLILSLATCFCAHAQETPLLERARGHVEIAEATRGGTQLWGRIGGSASERASAELLAEQLRPFVDDVTLEPVMFEAYRASEWEVKLSGGTILETAVPAPFDAWFPGAARAEVVEILSEDDWRHAKDRIVFVQATQQGSGYRTNVRMEGMYQRAVDAGAAALVFSLPTPPGDWRSAVPVDKAFAVRDEVYPDNRRPIPCFSMSRDDGLRLSAAAKEGETLSIDVAFDDDTTRHGLNAAGVLRSGTGPAVLLGCHNDAFFSGANDDASGIAVTVGLAEALSNLTPDQRKAEFHFVGLSAHHDEGEGMRAFVAEDADRMARIETAILLEHLDAHHGDDAGTADWPSNLNNLRAAYVGPEGWPEVESVLPDLVRDTGLMTAPLSIRNSCIADLYVICGDVQPFCLIESPPFYHTNHDTMDKLTEQGLRNAVEFHLRLLEIAGYIERN